MEGVNDFEEREHKENKNIIDKKDSFIKQLKNEGVPPFKIACIFNTSEYRIKKILKGV